MKNKKSSIGSNVKVLYLNSNNELFVQYHPHCEDSLIFVEIGKKIKERLSCGKFIKGTIVRKTKTGFALCNWKIR